MQPSCFVCKHLREMKSWHGVFLVGRDQFLIPVLSAGCQANAYDPWPQGKELLLAFSGGFGRLGCRAESLLHPRSVVITALPTQTLIWI